MRTLVVTHAALINRVSSVVLMAVLHNSVFTLTLVTITTVGVKLPLPLRDILPPILLMLPGTWTQGRLII
jgi:hypothetical protein